MATTDFHPPHPSGVKMTNVTANATINPLTFLEGYHFECACGESYNSIRAASSCRKCRNYSIFGYCTHVIDQRTGEVVHGTAPTEEEYEVAALEWESMRAIERKEAEMWEAERRAEEARLMEEQAQKAVEQEEDLIWEIQDRLMGVV